MKDKIIEIKFKSKEYPNILAQIQDPPKAIYCRGNLSLLKTTCFAVVGTRKLTAYGKEAGEFFVRKLAQSGFTIVSGLALGIDAVAHRTTLDVGGKTIAVLGSSLEDSRISPTTNFKLAIDILKKDGLIISEYARNIPASDFTFPLRNRIVSGLSVGVLVVEGDKKSGTLITARLAAEQGRDVFAIPGNIFSPKSEGPNSLIQKGAKPVINPDDILEEYEQLPLFTQEKKLIGQNETQNQIMELLKIHSPLSADEISEKIRENISKILTALSIMEMNGLIKELGPGKYRIK